MNLFPPAFVNQVASLSESARRLLLAKCADICGAAVTSAWPELDALVESAIEAGWSSNVASVKAAVARLDEELNRRSGVLTLGLSGLGTLEGALDALSRPKGPQPQLVLDLVNETVGVVMFGIQAALRRADATTSALDRQRAAERSEPVRRLMLAFEQAVAAVQSGGDRQALQAIPFLSFPQEAS